MVLLTTIEEPGLKTERKDLWWFKPLLQATIFATFVLYSSYAAIFGSDHYEVKEYKYISPLYNPDFQTSWWPSNVSPALMLIWAPIGFRATCYYARKVYYRAFFADPAACAVGELRKVDQKYKGENKWPFILNNLHRYFFYAAFILAIFHWISFFETLYFDGEFRLGLGGILLGLDATLLSLYLLSCHSCKHIVGGGLNCNSCSSISRARFRSWRIVKKLNTNHHAYFWMSLTTVILADIYIRLVSMGTIDDVRLFG
jgi:hypothetical protein